MGKSHSLEKKVFALEMLEHNNLNYAKTTKEIGISKATLEKWYLEKQQQQRDRLPEEPVRLEAIKELILKCIYKLLPETNDIDKLGRTLTIINKLASTQKEPARPNIYQIISEKLANGSM